MTTFFQKLAPDIAKLAESKGMKLLREDYDPSSFGNAVVELESVDLNLRVVRDRGDIRIEVSPPGEGDWHDLVNVMTFLGEESIPADVNSLGIALSARYDHVAALMSSDRTRVGLIRFEKTRSASFLRALFPSAQEDDAS